MMEQDFQRVYEKFKLQFFRRLFSQVREREGSLSAMEAFSVEVIHQLNAPTIGRFADFLGISQSNATYKVNNLIRKGYIVKENSDTDRREYHLKLSDKFYKPITVSCRAISTPCSDASARGSRPRSWRPCTRAGRHVGRADARVRRAAQVNTAMKTETVLPAASVFRLRGCKRSVRAARFSCVCGQSVV